MIDRSTASVARHTIGSLLEAILLLAIPAALVMSLALAAGSAPVGADSAFAAKGGRGNGSQATAVGSCTVDGSTVSGAGLPTDEVINFFVTDAVGKTGWVLGFSDDGTWVEPVAPANGPTTYEFASRTWGPNGSHYTVFASCSAG